MMLAKGIFDFFFEIKHKTYRSLDLSSIQTEEGQRRSKFCLVGLENR